MKKFKKLTLNKEVVSILGGNEMNLMKGGMYSDADWNTCNGTCFCNPNSGTCGAPGQQSINACSVTCDNGNGGIYALSDWVTCAPTCAATCADTCQNTCGATCGTCANTCANGCVNTNEISKCLKC